MRTISILLGVTSLLLLTTCKKLGLFCANGKGSAVTQNFSIDPFSSIDLKLDADLVLTPGATQQVAVTGQQNIIDRLSLIVSSGVLTIDYDKCYKDADRITIAITSPDLLAIIMNSVGDITATGTFAAERFDITHKASGSVTMPLDVDVLAINHEGDGALTLTGTADRQEVDFSGSGDYHGFGVTSDTCFVVSAAGGDVEVNVTNYLDVHITSSGNVYYKGYPTIVQDIEGTGQLIDAN